MTAMVAVTLAVALAAAPAIVRELDDGLRLRRFHYGAGLRLFRDSPWVGRGLDSYAYESMRVMSPEYVVLAREKLSSSVHSIPLGMFSAGGLLLGLSYLGFVIAVLWVGVRRVWSERGSSVDQSLLIAAVCALVAFHLQSLVTVENVALFVALASTCALVVAEADPLRWRSSATTPRRRATSALAPWALALPVIAGVLLAVPATRPFRSAVAVQASRVAAERPLDALRHLDHAGQLTPWDGYVTAQRAEVLAILGRNSEALTEALRAAEQVHYYSLVTPELARLAAEMGGIGDAVRLMEGAVASNPTSLVTARQASALYTEIARALLEVGRVERATDLLMLAVRRDPGHQQAVELLRTVGP